MEAKIRERIEGYRRQRDALVEQANRQVAALNGAIEALEELLKPEPEAPPEPALAYEPVADNIGPVTVVPLAAEGGQ